MKQRKGIGWNDLETKTTKNDGMPQPPKTSKWSSVFAERNNTDTEKGDK